MDVESVEKLFFEEMDFRFSAAYDVYSNNFDSVMDPLERRRLNGAISSLSRQEISYTEFYELIKPVEDDPWRPKYHRSRIETSHKGDYQARERREARNRRHR